MATLTTRLWHTNPRQPLIFCALLLISCVLSAAAQAFSLQVTPPRFELKTKPGKVVREVFSMTNDANFNQKISIKTNDWHLTDSGEAVFQDALSPNSCRPWVSIEAKTVKLSPRANKRFRFEVKVPDNTPAQECSFAIMLEGDAGMAKGSVAMPISGRIAVIVYVNVGEASANLQLQSIHLPDATPNNPVTLPVALIRNIGQAHGRLSGFVTLTDATGTKWDLVPSADVILPGKSREITFTLADDKQPKLAKLKLPAKLKGDVDYDNTRLPINTTLTR